MFLCVVMILCTTTGTSACETNNILHECDHALHTCTLLWVIANLKHLQSWQLIIKKLYEFVILLKSNKIGIYKNKQIYKTWYVILPSYMYTFFINQNGLVCDIFIILSSIRIYQTSIVCCWYLIRTRQHHSCHSNHVLCRWKPCFISFLILHGNLESLCLKY